MTHYDSVVADAKKLSLDDRLKLIDELTLEIPDDAFPTVSEDSVEEFDRRVLEMRNGTVDGDDAHVAPAKQRGSALEI